MTATHQRLEKHSSHKLYGETNPVVILGKSLLIKVMFTGRHMRSISRKEKSVAHNYFLVHTAVINAKGPSI